MNREKDTGRDKYRQEDTERYRKRTDREREREKRKKEKQTRRESK